MSKFNFNTLPELGDSPVARDLKINLERLLSDSHMTPDLSVAVLLATSTAVDYPDLTRWAEGTSLLSAEDSATAKEVAGIMGMLNTYYRFRHFLGTESEQYGSTGLRMTSLAKPVIGKERFEVLALAVSIVNGCEKCVSSHEKALRELGVSVDVGCG
jgi:lipoyl-dependent peroxiredoxin subunit D